MKNHHESIKAALTGIIAAMTKTSMLYAKAPEKDFIRTRKLPFDTMLMTLISMGGNTLSKELMDCQGYTPDVATSSAFVQQRDKILPLAFEFLLQQFTSSCAKVKYYNGYRLIAVELFIGKSQAGDRPGSEGSLLKRVLTEDDLMAFAGAVDRHIVQPQTAVALGAAETLNAGRGTPSPQTATPITDFMRTYCEGIFSKEDAQALAKEEEKAAIEREKREAEEKAEREKAEKKRLAKIEAENKERQLVHEKEQQIRTSHLQRLVRAENKFHLIGTADAHRELEALQIELATEQAAFVKIANRIHETDNYTNINAELDSMVSASEKREIAERKPYENFIADWRIKAEAEQAAREKQSQEAFDAMINKRVAEGIEKALAAHGIKSDKEE